MSSAQAGVNMREAIMAGNIISCLISHQLLAC